MLLFVDWMCCYVLLLLLLLLSCFVLLLCYMRVVTRCTFIRTTIFIGYCVIAVLVVIRMPVLHVSVFVRCSIDAYFVYGVGIFVVVAIYLCCYYCCCITIAVADVC